MEIYPMLYEPDFQNKNTVLYGNVSYVISTGFSKQKYRIIWKFILRYINRIFKIQKSAFQRVPAALVARRKRSAGRNYHNILRRPVF